MTPAEFRAALQVLGYTQRGFANYVGANERTVRRWAIGEQDIPQWVPVILGLMHRAPVASIDAGCTIKVLVTENPKRSGTRSGSLWHLYEDGMMVADFIDAVKAAGYDHGLALSTIRWDVQHGFIAIG